MPESSVLTNPVAEQPELPPDQLRVCVQVARHDETTLPRLCSVVMRQGTSIIKYEALEAEDGTATLDVTLKGPERWHASLPTLFQKVIGVTAAEAYGQATNGKVSD
jgi:hypothetical protein